MVKVTEKQAEEILELMYFLAISAIGITSAELFIMAKTDGSINVDEYPIQ